MDPVTDITEERRRRMEDDARRDRIVSGLRELADAVAENPAIPTPWLPIGGVSLHVEPDPATFVRVATLDLPWHRTTWAGDREAIALYFGGGHDLSLVIIAPTDKKQARVLPVPPAVEAALDRVTVKAEGEL